MLYATLDFPGDMSCPSVLALEVPGFPKGRCHHDLKAFCESGRNNLFKSIIENIKYRWLVYYLSLLFTHLYERVLNHRMLKSKIFGKSSLNVSFGQGSCIISDFPKTNSVKAALLQLSLRSKIIIFNNNFAFCQAGFLKPFMISFCSMP